VRLNHGVFRVTRGAVVSGQWSGRRRDVNLNRPTDPDHASIMPMVSLQGVEFSPSGYD